MLFFFDRTVNEEPSGHVESTLTKTEMKTLDTGNYICKDKNDESMYTVYVTVLHSKYLKPNRLE